MVQIHFSLCLQGSASIQYFLGYFWRVPQLTSLALIIVNYSDLVGYFTFVAFAIHNRNETVFCFPRNALRRPGTTVPLLFFSKSSVFLSLNHLHQPCKHFKEHVPFLIKSFFFFQFIKYQFPLHPLLRLLVKQNPVTVVCFIYSASRGGVMKMPLIGVGGGES